MDFWSGKVKYFPSLWVCRSLPHIVIQFHWHYWRMNALFMQSGTSHWTILTEQFQYEHFAKLAIFLIEFIVPQYNIYKIAVKYSQIHIIHIEIFHYDQDIPAGLLEIMSSLTIFQYPVFTYNLFKVYKK